MGRMNWHVCIYIPVFVFLTPLLVGDLLVVNMVQFWTGLLNTLFSKSKDWFLCLLNHLLPLRAVQLYWFIHIPILAQTNIAEDHVTIAAIFVFSNWLHVINLKLFSVWCFTLTCAEPFTNNKHALWGMVDSVKNSDIGQNLLLSEDVLDSSWHTAWPVLCIVKQECGLELQSDLFQGQIIVKKNRFILTSISSWFLFV